MFKLLTIALICVCLPACSLLRGACAAAMPVITQAQSYEADAAQTLEQAALVFQAASVPENVRAAGLAAIDKARTALRVASATLRAASGACSSPDLIDVFKEFIAAWGAIAPLLTQASGQLAAPLSPATTTATFEPAIVTMSRQSHK